MITITSDLQHHLHWVMVVVLLNHVVSVVGGRALVFRPQSSCVCGTEKRRGEEKRGERSGAGAALALASAFSTFH